MACMMPKPPLDSDKINVLESHGVELGACSAWQLGRKPNPLR